MPDNKFKVLWTDIRHWLSAYPWADKLVALRNKLLSFLASWWKLLLAFLAAVIFLYYPLGGWLIHNIDTSSDYEINTPPDQSATVEMMSFLVKREVSDKMWTPNLPFIFPSFFLDNMPNFQLGLMSAVSQTATSLSKRIDKPIAAETDQPLHLAAELLRYPGTVWMFSPSNKLTPVPSAGNQYKKARKQLISFNRDLRNGSIPFYKSPADLRYFMDRMISDLRSSNSRLEAAVRENSTGWIDLRADDVFYFQKGKLYGYLLLFKALGHDYKDILVNADIYQPWTAMLNALEQGVLLDPAIVRNGALGSVVSPNHLSEIGWFTLKAADIGHNIVQKLEPGALAKPKEN